MPMQHISAHQLRQEPVLAPRGTTTRTLICTNSNSTWGESKCTFRSVCNQQRLSLIQLVVHCQSTLPSSLLLMHTPKPNAASALESQRTHEPPSHFWQLTTATVSNLLPCGQLSAPCASAEEMSSSCCNCSADAGDFASLATETGAANTGTVVQACCCCWRSCSHCWFKGCS